MIVLDEKKNPPSFMVDDGRTANEFLPCHSERMIKRLSWDLSIATRIDFIQADCFLMFGMRVR